MNKKLSQHLKRYLRWSLLSALSGILSGLAATVFLWLLQLATDYREINPIIIWALPIAGFAIGWIYHHHGSDIAAGNNLILDEIHDPKKVVPLSMAPFILFGTLITHLFGGSAGREGTAVQMGASLSDQLSRFFKIEPEERKILLTTGAGAGFGAAIGTPWAGVVFGMEVVRVGRLRPFAVVESTIASFVGYFVTHALHAPHSTYPAIAHVDFAWLTLFWIALAGIAFGLSAMLFIQLTHFVERLQRKISYPPLKPLIAGLLLVLLYHAIGTYRYAGLGIPVIQESINHVVSFLDPALKAGFTALTIGSGFKGGEFIPLVFIGATLGSALSMLIPVAVSILAVCGFAAVFGGASNTPLACSIMAIEIFGVEIAPYAVTASYVSYLCSGGRSIYRSQKVEGRKHDRFVYALSYGASHKKASATAPATFYFFRK